MGCDPKAILYYGFPLPEEPEEYDNLNTAWQDKCLPKPEDNGDYRTPEWGAWRKKLAKWKQSAEFIEVAFSGSEHQFTHYVHCAALEKSVEWEEQLKIGPDALLRTSFMDKAEETLHEFCSMNGIEYQQPAWHLACLYF